MTFHSHNPHKIVTVRVVKRPHMEHGKVHQPGQPFRTNEKRAAQLVKLGKVKLHSETTAMTAPPEIETKEQQEADDGMRTETEETEEKRVRSPNRKPRTRGKARREAGK